MKNQQEIQKKYVSFDEFAEILSVSRRYVCDLVAQKVLPSVKFGRKCVRIPLEKALKKVESMER